MQLFLFFLTVVFSSTASAGFLPVEPRFEDALWNLRNFGQPFRIDSETLGQPGLAGADIKILDAWKIQSTAPGVTVAVIDGSFDTAHPDLADAFAGASAYDFLADRPGLPPPGGEETSHHGTMVSGVIGANGLNKIGITGVARQVRILPLEAIPEEGNERDSAVARAIRYAVEQGARVINCSFGKFSTSGEVRAAVELARQRDVLIVAGAGNDGKNVDGDPFWPAAYSRDFPNVISVAASDRRDRLWPASNFGKTVDLAAPGHEIFTTAYPGKPLYRYSSFSGTSAAAPHVAAVAGLMIARHPAIHAREIKELLLRSADPLPALAGKVRSGGRLNAARALQEVEALARAPSLAGQLLPEENGGCDLTSGRSIVSKNEQGHTALWSLQDSPALALPYDGTGDPAYRAHAAWVRAKTRLDARGILEHQRALLTKALGDLAPGDSFRQELERDIRNLARILDGSIGRIHPLTCLESLPFRELLGVVDLRRQSVEMSATVLRKQNEIRIIGDFYRPLSPDNGAPGVAESPQAKALRQKLEHEGWQLISDYHNHPFDFSNPWGDVGGETAPSNPDIRHYRETQPSSAWITNGLETIELDRSDFAKFEL